MAITTLATPSAYMPVATPAYWTASSGQTGQPNFKFYVVFTDLISGNTYTKKYNPIPGTTKVVFDSNFFAELYVVNFVPNNQYNFKKCDGGIRQIKVNIGEYYGSTPAVFTGSDQTYIVWNGSLDEQQVPDYAQADYLYKASTTNYKYLINMPNTSGNGRKQPDVKTYSGKSHFVYCMSSENNDLEFFRINTYNSAGTLIGQYDIPNAFTAGTTYTNKYVCIDVGHKGLSALVNVTDYTVVFGSAPIITDSVSYYDVIDSYTAPPATARATIVRIYIGCEPKYEVYTIHYLNKYGKFETCHFPKVSTINSEVVKAIYNQNPYSLNASNVYTFTKFTPQERVYASSITDSLVLQSDWLTYDEITAHKDLISSPVMYLDYGSTIGLIPFLVDDRSYVETKKWNTNNPYFQIRGKKGSTSRRQRG